MGLSKDDIGMVTGVMLQEICPGAGGFKAGDFVEERLGGPSRTTVDGTTSRPVIRDFLTASMKYRINIKTMFNHMRMISATIYFYYRWDSKMSFDKIFDLTAGVYFNSYIIYDDRRE